MRKLAYLAAGTIVLTLVATVTLHRDPAAQQTAATVNDSITAPRLGASDTAALKGPRQPIFFRHDIHAGQYKIQCQYCHYTVAVSSEPGIPSLQTCMGCHSIIAGSDSSAKAEIRKLRTLADSATKTHDRVTVQWVRVHTLARHAHFPHMRHIKAMGPSACFTCHGEVSRMPQVFKVNNINNMGFCITCHIERKVTRDCTACHY
ncbi:MAG: cytochrome c3 family protein [Gemmatimonadota bacterium]